MLSKFLKEVRSSREGIIAIVDLGTFGEGNIDLVVDAGVSGIASSVSSSHALSQPGPHVPFAELVTLTQVQPSIETAQLNDLTY
ncbi:hypothetical protein VNO77_33322 [Canavalia gladiata]|uniref:Uncharacterized protein n=1 Tax=Canavalia gladiata TaxID=3824 RepID=A0AAN9PYT3_CANGL